MQFLLKYGCSDIPTYANLSIAFLKTAIAFVTLTLSPFHER